MGLAKSISRTLPKDLRERIEKAAMAPITGVGGEDQDDAYTVVKKRVLPNSVFERPHQKSKKPSLVSQMQCHRRAR